jgi:general secretion pathway protein A
MYNRFWGFSEKPFKLVPNPDFLFLSATHEEALAHLKFTLDQGEGFLMITGEVGTGKSTLCRAFFQELDASVACAYIFNPKLDALQLLESINTEFGIPADDHPPHELVEILNAFLIDQRASGKKAIIIIDEAQNLPAESLEQLRLLSNLETTREKLLQIVLVGQPELAETIESFELRQLGQRITLACHLRPLSYDETIQYIQHRVGVVSRKPQKPFEKGALKAIYRFSGGVPRLINTACDRMLLAAYLKNRSTISATLAAKIIDELTRRGRPKSPAFSWLKVGIYAGTVVLATMAVLIFFYGRTPKISPERQIAKPLASKAPATSPTRPTLTSAIPASTENTDYSKKEENAELTVKKAPEDTSKVVIPLDELVRSIRHSDNRRLAIEAVLHQWGLQPQGDMPLDGVDDWSYFQIIAAHQGLSIQTIRNNIGNLAILNLPAIIQLKSPVDNGTVYLSVISMQNSRYLLTTGGIDSSAHIDTATLVDLWGGVAIVPWKNYMGYPGIIPGAAPSSSVVILKQLLWELGYSHLTIDDRYDVMTRLAIRELQAKHGLVVDGIVGNMTKIILFNEKRTLPIPHLRR